MIRTPSAKDEHMDPTKAPEEPAPGLERHLRSLILSNAASSGSQTDTPPVPVRELSNLSPPSDETSVDKQAVSSPLAGHVPQTTQSGRKRPNQAQRRQMGSQFSVAVDTRPQNSFEPPLNHSGQQWRTTPHQRHIADSQHPPPGFDRAMEMPLAHGHWNGPQGPSPPLVMHRFPHRPQHQQGGPVPAPLDPSSPTSTGWRHGPGPLYHSRRPPFRPDQVDSQATLLDRLCYDIVSGSEIQRSEIAEKEAFRMRIEYLVREAINRHEQVQAQRGDFPSQSVELKCFGSLSSGFATKASDMDLALLSPLSAIQPDDKGSPIPRLVEKALLDAGIGARLLTRTRVPIIKLCEQPPENLYRELLAQRETWEDGLSGENQEYHDDDDPEQDGHGIGVSEHKDDGEGTAQVQNPALAAVEFEVPSIDGGDPKRFYLKQRPETSLTSYYGVAKSVLRKAGGLDVRAPTIHTFTDLQWEILNRVCKAFIQGLADPQLRQRLEKYPSLSFKPTGNMPFRHSLLTTFTQIEGEHLLLRWESWISSEGIETKDPRTEQASLMWVQAQSRTTYGFDPPAYNKELQTILERIKKTPSVQLAVLEQSNEETPSQYHTRASKVMDELGNSSINLPRGVVQSVTSKYISGVHPKEMKVAVADYIDSTPDILSLDAVARRHKSLYLARELSRAVEKELYDCQQAEDVRKYIDLLRSPLRKTTKGHAQYDFVVPVSKKSAPLVSRIRALQNLRPLVPNRSNERYKDRLEFPKSGAGVQCDINFSAHLALQNTVLLRCYSHTDPRVRPMVLFVKHWAKMRGINSGYRGTLSSYGYVLMVLHYLVNVAHPFVCPNLQQLAPSHPAHIPPAKIDSDIRYRGYSVDFWRNEEEIIHLASLNQLNHNNESVGRLLRGFFEYFAQSGMMSNGGSKGFDWGRDVLSIRTQGGLLSKQDKGWTGAKTVYEVQADNSSSKTRTAQPTGEPQAKPPGKPAEVKEVRLRYLFAIEDPFETDHNVARTVTHNGIVSIRDEFRRAWRIIKSAGNGDVSEDLLQDVSKEQEADPNSFRDLLYEIHGPVMFEDGDDNDDA